MLGDEGALLPAGARCRAAPAVAADVSADAALDADELRRRYVELGQSGPRIAADLGVGHEAVYRRMEALGIPRRRRPFSPDPEWLRRRYVDDGATVDEIAAEVGYGAETVRRALVRAGSGDAPAIRDRKVGP